MELRVLKYFLAVAREESISRAAEQLHMSQPPLSRQIRELEEELGKQLLVRGSRKVTLTEEGMILRRRAEEILSLAEKTRSEVMLSSEDVRGVISIGCAETEGMRVIARKFRALREDYPQVRIHLHSGNADDVLERLDKGLLDFGVVIEPTDLLKYDFLRLPGRDTWGLLMRRDHPLAQKSFITPTDLRNTQLLISRQSQVLQDFSVWLGQNIDPLQIVGTYNLLFNAAVMVEQGLGCALALDHLVDTMDVRPLCFRPLSPTSQVALNLVYKKQQAFSPAAEAFLQIVKADCGQVS